MVIGVIVFLLTCGAVGGWLYFSNQKPPNAAEQQAKQTKLLNDTVDKVQKLVTSGKQADAIKIIDDSIKSTDDIKAISILKLE